MKIRDVPFLIGYWVPFFFNHNIQFPIAATLILGVLMITKL